MASNKPKVSTKYIKARQKEQKVLDYLRANPDGAYPSIIATQIEENYETIKSSTLPRLVKWKKVKKHPIS